MTKTLWLLAGLLLLSTAVYGKQCLGSEPSDKLGSVVHHWQLLQASYKQMKITLEGKSYAWKDQFMPVSPAEDHVAQETRIYYLDLETSRCRIDITHDILLESKGYVSANTVKLYDGKSFQVYEPSATNKATHSGDLKYNPELRNMDASRFLVRFFDRVDFPVLLSVGQFPAGDGGLGDVRQLRPALANENYQVTGEGILDDHKCQILNAPLGSATVYNELWVDPQLFYRVVRFSLYNKQQESFRVNMSYKQRGTEFDLASAELLSQVPNRGLMLAYAVTTKEVLINPKFEDSLFHIDPTPGTIVHNAIDETVVRKSPSGQRDIPIAEVYDQDHAHSWPSSFTMMLAAALAVLVTVCLWWRLKKNGLSG